jgi:hypothetical protein
MYVVAIQGIVFGVVALGTAVALAAGKPWARHLLFVISGGVVITAIAAIIMPGADTIAQALFILCCACLSWGAWKWRNE